MAYEKEAVAETASAIPTQAAPIMREEAIFNPYKPRPAPSIGQPDKSGETVAAVESKPAEETVTLSPAAAAIARKEQKVRQQEQAVKARELALEKAQLEIAEFKAMKEKLKNKDYSALEAVGVDYNEYSQYQVDKLNGADPNKEALKKLADEVSGLKKSQEDNVSKQFEAAVNERRLATKELVDSKPEFSRIKKANAHEAVVQHILDTWEHDSKEISVEQAAQEVEELLTEKAKKWAALLEEEKEAAPEGEKKQLPPLKQGLKTLTNQVTTGEIKKPVKSFQHMSDSERWAEARRRAEEKLQAKG